MGYALKNKIEEVTRKKVNYSFLTPISEFINKEYKEIKDEITLDKDCMREVLEEIRANNTLVFVTSDNDIRVLDKQSCIRLYIEKDRDDDGKIIKEYLTIKGQYLFNIEQSWGSHFTGKVEQLFYVNDYDSFSNYYIDKLKEQEAEDIKETKERTIEKIKYNTDLFTDIKKFGLTVDKVNLEKYRKAEKIAGKDVDLSEAVKVLDEIACEESCYNEDKCW